MRLVCASVLFGSSLLVSGNLIDCLSSHNLNLVQSSSPAFNADIAAYNRRLPYTPSALVYATNADQVSQAMVCAVSFGSAVSARGGGHGYASDGLGGQDGTLVIDVGAINATSLMADGVTASVGSGARLGNMALTLNDVGRGLSHGTCQQVGVGGHASMGGFGFASRWKGLLVDSIVALDVVLANGTILQNLTPQVDGDLFWALCGDAPDFGIITRFEFTTFAAPPTVIEFHYMYAGGVLSPTQAAKTFDLYQKFGLSNAPANMGFFFDVGADTFCDIKGMFYGTLNEFHGVMDAFAATLLPGFTTSTTSHTWLESLIAAAGAPLSTVGVPLTHDDFFAKSLMTPTDTPLTVDVMLNFFNYVATTKTATYYFIQADLYGGANSVVNSVSLATNSFGHRDKFLGFQLYTASSTSNPPFPAEGLSFVDGLYSALVDGMGSSWIAGGVPTYGNYVNYADPTLNASQWQHGYWSTQYPRLASLKGKYDPLATFRNPQSVKASLVTPNSTSGSIISSSTGTSTRSTSTLVATVTAAPVITTSATSSPSDTTSKKSGSAAPFISLSLPISCALVVAFATTLLCKY